MKTILILLLMAAPAIAVDTTKWDLDNLTPSQRSSLIIMRDRWNNGYRGTPRCETTCSWGLDRSSWGWRNPNVKTGRPHTSARLQAPGPQMLLNPYVAKAEGGGGK